MCTRQEVRSIVQEEIISDKFRSIWVKQLFGIEGPVTKQEVKDIVDNKCANLVTSQQLNSVVLNLVDKQSLNSTVKSYIADLKLDFINIIHTETSRILAHKSGLDSLYKSFKLDLNKDLDNHRKEINIIMRKNISSVEDVHRDMFEKYNSKVSSVSENTINELTNLGSESKIIKGIENKLANNLDVKMSMHNKNNIITNIAVGFLSCLAGIVVGSVTVLSNR